MYVHVLKHSMLTASILLLLFFASLALTISEKHTKIIRSNVTISESAIGESKLELDMGKFLKEHCDDKNTLNNKRYCVLKATDFSSPQYIKDTCYAIKQTESEEIVELLKALAQSITTHRNSPEAAKDNYKSIAHSVISLFSDYNLFDEAYALQETFHPPLHVWSNKITSFNQLAYLGKYQQALSLQIFNDTETYKSPEQVFTMANHDFSGKIRQEIFKQYMKNEYLHGFFTELEQSFIYSSIKDEILLTKAEKEQIFRVNNEFFDEIQKNEQVPTLFRNRIEQFRLANSLRYSSDNSSDTLEMIRSIPLNTKENIQKAEYFIEAAIKSRNHKMIANLFKIIEKKRSENSKSIKTDIFDQRMNFYKFFKMVNLALSSQGANTHFFWNSIKSLIGGANYLENFHLISGTELLKIGEELVETFEFKKEETETKSLKAVHFDLRVLKLLWENIIIFEYKNKQNPFLDAENRDEIEKYLENGMNLILNAIKRGKSDELLEIEIKRTDAFLIVMKSKKLRNLLSKIPRSVLKFNLPAGSFNKLILNDQNESREMLEIMKSDAEFGNGRVQIVKEKVLYLAKNTLQIQQLAEWIRVLHDTQRNLTDFEIIYDGIMNSEILLWKGVDFVYGVPHLKTFDLMTRPAVEYLLQIEPIKFALVCHESFFKVYFERQRISVLTQILQHAIVTSPSSDAKMLIKRCKSAGFTDFTLRMTKKKAKQIHFARIKAAVASLGVHITLEPLKN